MNTLYLIIGFFALGAIIGMYLLSFVLQKKETPKIAAVIHGLFVAVALILLIIYNKNEGPGFIESIILFCIAALGGLVLIMRDLSGKSVPRWLAILHGLIALLGFIVLLVLAFTK